VSEYAWVETRLRAVEAFSDAPSAVQEQRVIDVFREHPALVVEAIEHVGRRFESGQVRNPWAILAKHVEEAVRPLEDVTATDERDREKRIQRASQWLRAAGKHFDSEAEVVDELFGERGLLREWRSDETLEARMVKLWRELRPEGELIESQALERAERWKAPRGQVAGYHGYPVTRLKPQRAESPESDPEPVLEDDPEPVLA
jgi:hypothetical protein